MITRILVVDDEADLREMLEKLLTSRGYRVVTAANGAEAMEIVSKDKPDLVVLDVLMPVMNGREVLKRLKGDPKFSDIPVIMLTSQSSDTQVMTGYVEGADYYITKPFNAPTLLQGIKLMEEEARSGPKKYEIG